MALRLRPDARPLLPRGVERARQAGRRPRPVARRRDLDRAPRRRVDRLRRPQPARLGPARALAGPLRPRRARRVGLVRALQPAGGLAPGRGDDRDGDGGERLLRHHPRAARARPGEGGGARARPGARHPGQAALGPEQLPHVARPADDARRALPVRVRRRPRLVRADRPDGDRRVGAALLQPAPHGTDALVDAGRGRARVRRARRLGRAGGRARRGTDDARERRARQAGLRLGGLRGAATRSRTPERPARSVPTSTPRSRRPRSSPTASRTASA